LSISPLAGPGGGIPAAAIDVGYVSYRISRVISDGAVYTIRPRGIVPRDSVMLPKGTARRFWLEVHIPAGAAPRGYNGKVNFTPQRGAPLSIPLQVTVRRGALDPADVAVGPFGGRVGTPWFLNDPATAGFNAQMTEKSLLMLRAHGFTIFTGVPSVVYRGFR